MYNPSHPQTAMRGPGGIFTMAANVQSWLDARGRGAWIATMILAFVFVWPLGLFLLAYLIWSKRMFNRSSYGYSRDFGARDSATPNAGGREFRGPWAHFGGCGQRHGGFRSSGNSAFDAYKEETLRRLQDEQEAFQSFLQRLREAKDKTEFDAFMDDRARQAKSGPATSGDVAPDAPKDGAPL